MWLGISYLGLDDTGNAYDALSLAEYMETRAFYRGMIELWLGKVADRIGERDVARKYYRSVIDGKSAQFHREEAERLMEQGQG